MFYFFTVKYGKMLHFSAIALCLAPFGVLLFLAGEDFPSLAWFPSRDLPLDFPFCRTVRLFESSSSVSCFILARVFCLFFCCKRYTHMWSVLCRQTVNHFLTTFGSLLSQIRVSSVTFVHCTQGVVTFGNISSPFCTLAILCPPCKILQRSSQGNPSVGGIKQEG